MVFRAKVRDDDKLYSPLGLESEGHRGRLPGRRQRLSLRHALLLLPGADLRAGQGRRMAAPRRGQRGLLRDASSTTCSASSSTMRGATGSPWSASSSRTTSPSCRAYPLTEVAASQPEGPRLDVARLCRRARPTAWSPPSAIPGAIGFVGTMDLATGKLRQLAEIKGMMLYKVTSLAFDPDSPQSLLHRRQLRLPRPHRDRRRHRQEAHAAARRADRRPGLQPAPTSRSGASATRTASRRSSAFPPPYAGFNQIHTFDYGDHAVRPRHLARRRR